jgi:hypothetical protein
MLAVPSAAVVDVAAAGLPCVVEFQLTTTPPIGASNLFVTLTTSGCASVLPTTPDWKLPAWNVNFVAGAAVAVALTIPGVALPDVASN